VSGVPAERPAGGEPGEVSAGNVLRGVGAALLVALLALQLVPYGRRHTNPRMEPRWDGPATWS
jgi:hypothetical protein